MKKDIKAFYDDTLDALILDLRKFSGSNLVAALIALGLALLARGKNVKAIVRFSLIMFVAMVYCLWMYVDDLSFFRILFRLHLGWFWIVLLAVACIETWWKFGRRNPAEERDATASVG